MPPRRELEDAIRDHQVRHRAANGSRLGPLIAANAAIWLAVKTMAHQPGQLYEADRSGRPDSHQPKTLRI